MGRAGLRFTMSRQRYPSFVQGEEYSGGVGRRVAHGQGNTRTQSTPQNHLQSMHGQCVWMAFEDLFLTRLLLHIFVGLDADASGLILG